MTAIVFLLCFVVGCAMALARHPIFGLMTYVAVYYLHPPSRWWGHSLPDLRWSLLAAFVTLAALVIHNKKLKPLSGGGQGTLIAGYAVFVIWLLIQSLWALEPEAHWELIVLYAKYILLMWLMIKIIDSEKHLLWFCWTHVLGCLFLGWVAYTGYKGGRFEEFGGPDISEANAGALQLVSGVFIGAALFLMPSVKQKLASFFSMPLIVNAIILTSSRSAFLAAAAGGVFFNLFAPKKFRLFIGVSSALAVVLFFMLTNAQYWDRMDSLKAQGAEVEGVDTGYGRVVLMQAQLLMFKAYPLGCGHRCTVTLSPQYLDEKYLSWSTTDQKGRASHSTVLTLLVEQGVIGVFMYGLGLVWIASKVFALRRKTKGKVGFVPLLLPALVAFLFAITVGDLFVDYLKSEVRAWFLGLLIVATRLAQAAEEAPAVAVAPISEHAGLKKQPALSR